MTFLAQTLSDRATGKRRGGQPKHGHPISVLCEQAGISRNTYHKRRKAGLTHEQALSYPRQVNQWRIAWHKPDPTAADHATVNHALRNWK
jgi:hypothetical protein